MTINKNPQDTTNVKTQSGETVEVTGTIEIKNDAGDAITVKSNYNSLTQQYSNPIGVEFLKLSGHRSVDDSSERPLIAVENKTNENLNVIIKNTDSQAVYVQPASSSFPVIPANSGTEFNVKTLAGSTVVTKLWNDNANVVSEASDGTPKVFVVNDGNNLLNISGQVNIGTMPNVTVSSLPSVQVSSIPSVSFGGTSQPVNFNGIAQPILVNGVTVANNALKVDGSAFTQPVSGTVEITNDAGNAIPVNGTVTANISGSISNTGFAIVNGNQTAPVNNTDGLSVKVTNLPTTQTVGIDQTTAGANHVEIVNSAGTANAYASPLYTGSFLIDGSDANKKATIDSNGALSVKLPAPDQIRSKVWTGTFSTSAQDVLAAETNIRYRIYGLTLSTFTAPASNTTITVSANQETDASASNIYQARVVASNAGLERSVQFGSDGILCETNKSVTVLASAAWATVSSITIVYSEE